MAFFEEAYHGTPPWDIGRPQSAVVRAEEAGEIVGRVIDLGCGTGENACYLASRGHPVVGVDLAPTAIEKARAKAKARGLAVTFEVGNALDREPPRPRFDSLVDCGLFHTFDDPERPRYARSVGAMLRPGGRLFVLCFSEREPAGWGGPRRVTQAELRATFRDGWRERSIREERFDTNLPEVEGWAWLGAFERAPVARPRSTRGAPRD
jgi:cyclopropane fatty-acyl-phospholipid synthase-like methyltransferase